MERHGTLARVLAVTALTALTVVTLLSGPVPARVRTPHFIDPAQLSRGPDPRVAHLIGDTIVDGHRRVPATRLGDHWGLWTTARGYVVNDYVEARRVFRLVYVSRSGDKRLIARRGNPAGVAVSPSRRQIAWGQGRAPVRVADPDTGRVIARRMFLEYANVVAVSGTRVLLTLQPKEAPATTWWWDYRRNVLSRLSDQGAVGADIRHDRIVLRTGTDGRFCNRVAPLSQPDRTLWSSCRTGPRAWSPDGRRALATWTYFDELGTDRWLTVRDGTGERVARVTGRLDPDAVWEDDRHFLTMAQSNRGIAAVIRCTVRGRCERASRLWDVGWDGYPPFYVSPPVVLADNP